MTHNALYYQQCEYRKSARLLLILPLLTVGYNEVIINEFVNMQYKISRLSMVLKQQCVFIVSDEQDI